MRYVANDCEKRKQQQTNPKMTTHSKHFKRKKKKKSNHSLSHFMPDLQNETRNKTHFFHAKLSFGLRLLVLLLV